MVYRKSLTVDNLLWVLSLTMKYASSNISSCSMFSPASDILIKLPCLLKLTILLKALCNFWDPLVDDSTGETGADFETSRVPPEVCVCIQTSLRPASDLCFFSVRYISAMSPSSSMRCSISSRTWKLKLHRAREA